MVATGVSIFISPVFAILPATKVNVPFDQIEQGRIGLPVRVVHELVQCHAGVARQIERGAIGEVDSDPAIGAGLDHVALVDEITNLGLTGLTGDIGLNDHRLRMFNCDRTRGGYNFPDRFWCDILNSGLGGVNLRARPGQAKNYPTPKRNWSPGRR